MAPSALLLAAVYHLVTIIQCSDTRQEINSAPAATQTLLNGIGVLGISEQIYGRHKWIPHGTAWLLPTKDKVMTNAHLIYDEYVLGKKRGPYQWWKLIFLLGHSALSEAPTKEYINKHGISVTAAAHPIEYEEIRDEDHGNDYAILTLSKKVSSDVTTYKITEWEPRNTFYPFFALTSGYPGDKKYSQIYDELEPLISANMYKDTSFMFQTECSIGFRISSPTLYFTNYVMEGQSGSPILIKRGALYSASVSALFVGGQQLTESKKLLNEMMISGYKQYWTKQCKRNMNSDAQNTNFKLYIEAINKEDYYAIGIKFDGRVIDNIASVLTAKEREIVFDSRFINHNDNQFKYAGSMKERDRIEDEASFKKKTAQKTILKLQRMKRKQSDT